MQTSKGARAHVCLYLCTYARMYEARVRKYYICMHIRMCVYIRIYECLKLYSIMCTYVCMCVRMIIGLLKNAV